MPATSLTTGVLNLGNLANVQILTDIQVPNSALGLNPAASRQQPEQLVADDSGTIEFKMAGEISFEDLASSFGDTLGGILGDDES